MSKNIPYTDEDVVIINKLRSKEVKFSKLRVKFRDNPHVALVGATLDYTNLAYIKPEVKNNFDFASLCLKSSGYGLKYFSEDIRNNRDLVKIAISTSPFSYSYISPSLRQDKELAVLAINKGFSFALLSEYHDDYDIVSYAVNNTGRSLVYASDRLKDDRGIILKAVDNDPSAIEFASKRFIDLCLNKEPSKAIREEIAKEEADKLKSELSEKNSNKPKLKI